MHSIGICRTIFLLCAAILAWAIAAPVHARPSFQCTGTLTGTERVICRDMELSAYDRAMAWAYSHGWKKLFGEPWKQRQWLAKRNGCVANRRCILLAYRDWVGDLDPFQLIAPSFERTNSPDPKNDSASLSIVPVGGDWFLFQVVAVHGYEMPGGRGPSMNDGLAVGLVHLTRNMGSWFSDLDNSDYCSVDFRRRSERVWQLAENGMCSGIGATLTGTYRK